MSLIVVDLPYKRDSGGIHLAGRRALKRIIMHIKLKYDFKKEKTESFKQLFLQLLNKQVKKLESLAH